MNASVPPVWVALLVALSTSSWAFGQDECVTCSQNPACDALPGTSVFGCDSCGHCPADCCCIWSSPTVTGDWLGHRSCLQESGITFAGRSTHFGFGVDGGIDSPLAAAFTPLGLGNTFKYTGRGEYDLLFDLEKFGGLPHGKLLVRAEHWYGQFGNVSLNTEALTPAVFPGLLPPVPNDPGTPFITNFLITQPLSERLVVFAGKKDVLGSADQEIFAGGDGTSQFVNQAFVANPAFLLALPYSGFTMGAAMPQSWGMISGFIFDPKDRTKDFFNLDDLFAQGIIVGGEVKVNTNFFCLPGEQHIGGIWKHVDLTDLTFAEPPPGDYPYEPVPGFATLSDAYTIYYGFDQYFVEYPGERPGMGPKKDPRGWGMFGRASISDGNPTAFALLSEPRRRRQQPAEGPSRQLGPRLVLCRREQ